MSDFDHPIALEFDEEREMLRDALREIRADQKAKILTKAQADKECQRLIDEYNANQY